MSSHSSKVVVYCCLANFINAADRAIFPIAILPMAKLFRWSLKYQGWILSSFAFGYITSQLIAGSLVKHFGARKMLLFAVLTWSFFTTITPYVAATSVALLIATRILLGFAEGVALPTIYHLFSTTVSFESRSRAFGYLSALGSAGQTVAAILCPHMKWPIVFYMFGMTGFFWALFWLKDMRYEPLEYSDTTLPLYSPNVKSKIPEFVKEKKFMRFFRYWPLWAIYLAHFSMNWSSYVVVVWLPTYLDKMFYAKKTDLSFTALPYVANSLMGAVSGHIADSLVHHRFSILSVRRLMTAIGLFGPGIFILMFMSVENVLLAVILISLSMGLSAFNSAGHLSNHVDVAPNDSGLTFAISNTLATIPGILAGPLSAEIVTASHGRWFPVFIIAAFINFVGGIIYVSQSAAKPIV